ncbi:MAG: efflux RND transporter periplasmic adaptor subunit [Acidobacteria bacterium]|jgi:membrane fusion protein (multidrug efflux system)|nr:efflux RND transporter periplasmic adaptor subunit [Acidobacteriota bacterium]
MKSRFDRTFLPGLALLGALAALPGCGSGDTRSEAAPPDAEGPRAPAVSVQVAELVPQSLVERVELSGELEPWVHVSVSAELGGTVELVGFREGEHVRKGQVLARVGTDMMEAALAEAQARLEGAQAVHEKTAELFKRQHVPRQELIAATSALHAAEAQVRQAELRRERSVIEAPISGVAATRDVEPGEVVAPGAPITEIYRVDRLKAVAGVPENDVTAFRVGGEATIEVDAFPGRVFEGRIHLIGPAAVGPSRTFPTEIAVDNPKGELRPGMIARVALVKRQLEDVVVVDRDVLQDRDVGPVAVVVQGGVASVRELTLGASEGNRVVVEQGLEPGEMLIVTGQRGLVDGQAVEVVEGRP